MNVTFGRTFDDLDAIFPRRASTVGKRSRPENPLETESEKRIEPFLADLKTERTKPYPLRRKLNNCLENLEKRTKSIPQKTFEKIALVPSRNGRKFFGPRKVLRKGKRLKRKKPFPT